MHDAFCSTINRLTLMRQNCLAALFLLNAHAKAASISRVTHFYYGRKSEVIGYINCKFLDEVVT